jgi:dynein heavy chain 1, cytosolic
MKKVYKSPFVIDVMNIQSIQKSLERLADLLNKIQKALGEYLERERSSFPRFYFVGDEDLLEIIGNSKDILRIMKHLKKMFAGISTIMLDDDLTQIQGMASREGEEVKFSEPILLKDFPKINDWLAKIESMMRLSLADLLCEAVMELLAFYGTGSKLSPDQLMTWMEKYPAQLVTVAIQVAWTASVESSLEASHAPEGSLDTVLQALDLLADIVLKDLNPVTRRKCEHLITELVHQRDVTRTLIQQRSFDTTSFTWLYQMRFYLDRSVQNALERLTIKVADASFPYGWEYLGVTDRLVQTPLTDKVYLTLTQALDNQLGGSPFGPAGTGPCCFRRITSFVTDFPLGKTESVKALGVQLGRFVLVFCCDETFDFQAMGRIFVGLCQVGAWGCFDEFNRLEERILSAVSQQVQSIQQGLAQLVKNPNTEIELVGKHLKINKNIGTTLVNKTMRPADP